MNLKHYFNEFSYNLKLAIPVILAMLGHTLVGFIDNVMVGKLGTTELAAVSLGNSIIFFVMALGIGFSTAITTLTSAYYSEKNSEKLKDLFKHALLINSIFSIFLILLIFLAKPFMYATNQDSQVISLASPYINWVAFSLIPIMIFQVFKQFSDGFSLTKYAMYVTFIANFVNIILNYLLIYGNFGFPKMGIVGAAIGTLVSRITIPIIILFFLKKNTEIQQHILHINWKKFHFSPIKKIFSIGVPASLQMVFEIGVFVAATWISGSLGKNYQASNQIATSISSIAFMISAGMSVAAMIRTSHFFALKDYYNLRRVAISIFLFVFACQILISVTIILLRFSIPEVFLDTTNKFSAEDIHFVISDATKLLLICGIFQIPDGIQVVAQRALQGIQDVKIPVLITFIAYWVIAFPLSYFLGLHTPLKNQGIWIGLCCGLTFSAVFLLLRFQYLTRNKK